LAPAVADLTLDGPGDCNPLGRGEVLADLVLVVLTGDDTGHVHDPGQDRLFLEDGPDGAEAALTEDEFQPVRHADGLEQPLLANALGQGREVAHVPAVALAHHDVGDLDFLEHGMSFVANLPFLDLCIPTALDAALDRLVGWALLGIACQQPVHLLPASCGNLKAVLQANLGNAHHTVYVFDVALDLGHEVVCRPDPPHVQCGSQGAGQSAGDPGDDVVERGRVLRAGDLPPVLLLVEPLDAAV